ncbi:MAG: gamma-glutamyltranspeptidase / glutathione hydrolase [Solirubrobacteraceae bacterium]|jgi:gamma-glutamyltranspeptidase/glutathione hydrolase|nr:gamma-glutamyltranspeptidase / glutathione hydrolase [Solirubrobacteraceae bacterium]
MGGAIAAGHPATARAGADVLRAGGNAVDAAIAAVCVSLTAEAALTSLGGGGYMLVAVPGGEAVLLDFFVTAPGQGADPATRAELLPVTVSFGDAVQVFHVGPAAVGVYGVPAGLAEAARRFASRPLSELVAAGAAAAREGVALTAEQAYVVEILTPIYDSTPDCRALHEGLAVGAVFRNPELGDTLERLGAEGAGPFYEGDIAAAVLERLEGEGSLVTAADLAGYRAEAREPVRAGYRGLDVLTTPPPSAGGILIAHALSRLDRAPGPPGVEDIVEVMEAAQAERTPEFLEGLSDPGFVERFRASRMGSTTHISVLDGAGMACGVTCSNGEGSAILVPGTGIHLNNVLGEQDLNPLGFHGHPPGRRLPSMMSPTVVQRDGRVELVLGSGGSNRIRSAILQTVVNVVDRGMDVDAAVRAPRVHFEDGVVYAEPGIDLAVVEATGHTVSRFRAPNLFFGGVHAVAAGDPPRGGGDPRRGGAVEVVA